MTLEKNWTGKVARIINERELVINRGRQDGIEEDMILEVIDNDPEEVKDPDTGDVIGTLNPVKNYVKVTEVQDRMSVAATFISWRTGGGALSSISLLPNLFTPARTEYDTLEFDDDSSESDRDIKVRIGDIVRPARKLPR